MGSTPAHQAEEGDSAPKSGQGVAVKAGPMEEGMISEDDEEDRESHLSDDKEEEEGETKNSNSSSSRKKKYGLYKIKPLGPLLLTVKLLLMCCFNT